MGLRVREWREGGVRLDALLNRLAQAFNSNDQFEMDASFQLSIKQVHHPPQGTGKPRRTKPGHQNLKKLTVIRIHNEGVICCAINSSGDRQNQGGPRPQMGVHSKRKKIQTTLALLLHDEAHVPFDPCGSNELVKFSAAPSLYDYQILLVDADRAFHVTSFGPPSPKQLILLHEKGHYDVITSLPGFFGTSYVCATCLKPYNDQERHSCKNYLKCHACRQKGCPDFFHAYQRGLKASQRCDACGRNFFGDTCFQAHCTKNMAGNTANDLELTQSAISFTRQKCIRCFKLEVGSKNIKHHRCGYIDYPSCYQWVNGQSHRCFIQRALTPQEIQEQKKERQRKRQRQGGPLPNGVLPPASKP